ncbi:MAG: hypothetical protein WKF58_13805 [Ilumatobacteraceae bacterium]
MGDRRGRRTSPGWPRWIGLPLEIVMQTGTRWVFVVVAAFLIGVGRVRLGRDGCTRLCSLRGSGHAC